MSAHSCDASPNEYARAGEPPTQSASAPPPVCRTHAVVPATLGSQHCAAMAVPEMCVAAGSTHVDAGNAPPPPSSACTHVGSAVPVGAAVVGAVAVGAALAQGPGPVHDATVPSHS